MRRKFANSRRSLRSKGLRGCTVTTQYHFHFTRHRLDSNSPLQGSYSGCKPGSSVKWQIWPFRSVPGSWVVHTVFRHVRMCMRTCACVCASLHNPGAWYTLRGPDLPFHKGRQSLESSNLSRARQVICESRFTLRTLESRPGPQIADFGDKHLYASYVLCLKP